MKDGKNGREFRNEERDGGKKEEREEAVAKGRNLFTEWLFLAGGYACSPVNLRSQIISKAVGEGRVLRII